MLKFKFSTLVLAAAILLHILSGEAYAAARNLGMTASQFIQKYNASFENYGITSMRIGTTKNKSGAVLSTFQYMFTPNVGVIGSFGTADGLLREVCILSTPKTEDEAMKALMAFTCVSLVVNPEMKPSERDDLMHRLKLYNVDELQYGDGVAIFGNVKYTTQLIGGIFNFIASAKDL